MTTRQVCSRPASAHRAGAPSWIDASSWCINSGASPQIHYKCINYINEDVGIRYADGIACLGSPQCQGGRPGNAMTAEATVLLVQPSFSKPGVLNEIRH